jgi:hypothetical protein
MPSPDSRSLGGSPWMDSGLLEIHIPLFTGKKSDSAVFLRNPSRKHSLAQVFA